MPPARIRAPDAALLPLESEQAPMHAGWAALFAPPAPVIARASRTPASTSNARGREPARGAARGLRSGSATRSGSTTAFLGLP
jgi:hypothetical protein